MKTKKESGACLFFDIRLTPCKFKTPEPTLTPYYRNKILNHLNPVKYMMAEEKTGKLGEQVDLHYHIACELKEPMRLDSIQKWFRSSGISVGPRSYCVRPHIEPENEERWWRYCCKEKLLCSRGFDKETIEQYTLLAKDERLQSIERNVAYEKSKKEKNQKRDKLFAWLKKEKPDTKGTKAIFVAAVFWYREVCKDTPPLANKCLLNKVYDYQMEIGELTADQYYDMHYA